ncbi:MAG TPA: glucose-1-phosphate adenylyltransferase [Anaerolineaceae bacterium]|nr:glucose-1-phosphate adenylyltransferase [Anaerolineaceae bacterium]HPN51519.1 glucose-1-phosphate adenylyltransferase [Anaerolineaceae bacterium]
MSSVNDILSIILGGGRGSRLYPLTKMRSKPAVPMGGKYRLIDIPISNCINSGIYRIAVLTQFNSVSLHRHITRSYNFDTFHTGWVQIWAAEQTPYSADWYQGTADAVRKQLYEIQSTRTKYTLILAGDHLYRMDYAAMAKFQWDHNADITVAVQPVHKDEASRFGILKRDKATSKITDFAEKPKDPMQLASLVSRDDPQRPYLGSMGIYLFRTDLLVKLLTEYAFDDFGGDVIPFAIGNYNVVGYDFDDYWEDIGTIRSFYKTNLALAEPDAPFNLYDPERPIYSHPRYLPGSVIKSCSIEDVLLAEGCCIQNANISHSVIGLRSQINAGVRIKDSIIMGADYYQTDGLLPPVGIGAGCQISGAIIDKNARLGPGVIIEPFPRGTDIDTDDWVVRDGIVVVPKNAILPAGTHIGPGTDFS